jgi:hypothetical protein
MSEGGSKRETVYGSSDVMCRMMAYGLVFGKVTVSQNALQIKRRSQRFSE